MNLIRAVAIVSLGSLLALVFYLPAANPPERFLAQIREEQATIANFWGEAPALRILDRALSLEDSARQVTPIPSAADAPRTADIASAEAAEMAAVNQSLFNHAYFRSIGALVLLASFRVATLLEWLPWMSAFAEAAIVDGALLRVIKAREFRQHNPEISALHACAAIVEVCEAVVRFVIPVGLHRVVIAGVPMFVGGLVWRAMGSFHRRG
jgi:hypothetical protein